MERKAQMRLICELALADANESSLKTYLEKNIKGLAVTGIDNFAGEFIVTSNLLELVLGSESNKKDSRETGILKDEAMSLRTQLRIVEEQLAAVTKIKDHLAKNYIEFKDNNPEVKALTKRLQDTLKECQEMNKTSAITIEKNKALTKTMNQIEADKNILVENIQQLIERIEANKASFKLIVDKAKDSKDGDLYEMIRTYEEDIHKLVQNVTSALTKEIIESSVKDSLTKKRKSSVIEELFKNYAGSISKESTTQSHGEIVEAIKKELSEKCEELEELEEAYNNLENEYQLAENQIEILQINLEEKEKQIVSLKEKVESSKVNQSAVQEAAMSKHLSELKLELSKAMKTMSSKDEQIKILKTNIDEKNKELKILSDKNYSTTEISPKDSELLKKELANKSTVILQLKEDLAKRKLEIAELACKLDETEDELRINKQRMAEREKELSLLKSRVKDFEVFLENPEVLIKTQKQLEEFKKKYAERNKISSTGSTELTELIELKKKNEIISIEYNKLKMNLLAKEQQLMQYEQNNPLKDKENKYMIIEETKGLLIDVLSIFKTMNTMMKELVIEYKEKLEKLKECSKILDEYLGQKSKKERLKIVQDLESSFIFLHCLPKKVSNIGILDKCVIDMLKMKISKTTVYKDNLFKYDKLISFISKKYDEYEKKLTYY